MSPLYVGSTPVTLPGMGGPGTPLSEAHTSAQVSLTPSATPHVKGAWMEVIASTTEASTEVTLLADCNLSTVDTATLMDIGIGDIGSEVVIAPDIGIGGWINSSGSYGHAGIRLPLQIPSGSRVSVRAQSVTASNPTQATLTLYCGGNLLPSTSLDSLGTSTATSNGTFVGVLNTWTEVVASTPQDYNYLVMVPAVSGASLSGSAPIYTIAVGAPGSEVALPGRMYTSISNTEQIASQYLKPLWEETCIFPGVPAGSRLSVKLSLANAGAHVSILGAP